MNQFKGWLILILAVITAFAFASVLAYLVGQTIGAGR